MNIRTSTTGNPTLYLSHEDRLSPLGNGQLAIAGAVVVLLGISALGYIGWRNLAGYGEYLNLLPASLLSVGAGSLALLMHQHYRRPLSYQISFDPQAGLVSYQQQGHAGGWHRSISDIHKLLLVEQRTGASSARYNLYLKWTNDTYWWLLDSNDAADLRAQVSELGDFLQVPIEDRSPLGLNQQAMKQHKEGQASYDLKPSQYLREARLHGTLALRILRPYTLRAQLTWLLLLFWLLGVPYWTLYHGWLKDQVSASMYGSMGGLLLLIGAVVSIFLVYQKKYTLMLRPGGLQIEMGLGPAIIDRLISQKVFIPRASIKAVHVHRIAGGHFWLSLALQEPVKLPSFGRLMFNGGVFTRHMEAWGEEDGFEVGLWEVPAEQTSKQGPYLGDVLALKRLIERQYLKDLHDICT